MQALKLLGQQLSKIWSQLGINQKVIIIISGLAVLVGLGGLVYWSSRPSYALLFARLDIAEAGRIMTELDALNIPYESKSGGSSIYVHTDKVHSVRAQLATKGMPKSEGVGFEIFDKPAFGMSDFVQQVNYMRALEGELARTIAKFDGVESAQVKIVKPESRLLVDPSKKPTAAVFIKLRGNVQIEQTTVNAIRFLVANSVEGLKANGVSVVDSSGNVLSETSDEGSLMSLGTSMLAFKRNAEKYLEDKVKGMLDTVLGPNQATVRVSAEINNESLTKEDEFFAPNEKAFRTQSIKEDISNTMSPQPGGVPGVTTNASTESASSQFPVLTNSVTKKDTMTDYAISSSRTNLTKHAGNISKLSAAVMINTNGNPLFANASSNQVEETTLKLKQAVANALGEVGTDLAEVRNVSLTLVNFNRDHEVKLEAKLDKEQRKELYVNVSRWVLYGVLGLAALIGFWRLVRSSSEELLPTGIPVGQLVGGQLVYEAPAGVSGMVAGMAMPSGVAQTVADQQGTEAIMPEEQEVEELQAAKSKLVMDFGLGQQAPERITIEVLKQLIRENPAKMSQAARSWLSRKTQDTGPV
ncbi:MAG: flagellar M-ring protein FliF [Verrucomicrobia bacterium]|nr:flagellar M-ring protein FliF [Verrucomicrobiota bacterium]